MPRRAARARQRPIPLHCTKKAFSSQQAAEAWLEDQAWLRQLPDWLKQPRSAYRCPVCSRYHVTSQEARR
jgi:hypothetical protein